ncbi:MAG: hypothetical protein RL226_1271, partial [Bacteroidota bacterium]
TWTASEVIEEGNCPNNYTIVRTYNVVDACGNTNSAVQYITVQDTTAPEFVFVAEDVTIECDQEIPAPAAEAIDNCSSVTITTSEVIEEGECANSYTIVRTYTATDACGNSSTEVQNIVLEDTTAPVFDAYVIFQEIPCDMMLDFPPLTATDNCGEVTVTCTYTPVSGGCAGNIIRDCVAVDACGNTTYAQQIFLLVDQVAPEFVEVPANYSVECGTEVPACSPSDVVVEDNCTDVEVSCGDEIVEGDCAAEYTILRTYTAEDNCGNVATYTQTISVVDTTAPEFEMIGEDATIECDQDVPAAEAYVYDNCSEVSWTSSDATVAGECANEYTIVRTYVATDACGNTASATQTISVVDTTAPVFVSVAEDVTIECDQELPAPAAEVTDNCGDATWTVSAVTTPGQCANAYIMTRTYVATDACGNTETATQTITVIDTTAPEIVAIGADATVECDAEIPAPEAIVQDNCGDASWEVEESTLAGDCANEYTLVRTYTAMDACGNTATAVQTILVVDNTAPEFSFVAPNATIQCNDEIPAPAAQVTDNCGEASWTVSTETIEGGCPNNYTLVRTYVATDACGNTTEAQQTIEIIDSIAPEFTYVAPSETIECTVMVQSPSATASDNCDDMVDISVFEETIPGSCPQEYTIVRTYTATDNCGNSTTTTQTIQVVDTTAPIFSSVPMSMEISCDEELPTTMATASDNCGAVSIEFTDALISGDCPNAYTVVRMWVATDECGNASSAETEYYVYDDQAPVFTTVLENVSVECAEEVPAQPEVEATDNCSDVTISMTSSIQMDDCGNYFATYTYTAVDACGNEATPIFYTVTVLDETAPTFDQELPASLVIDCEAEVPAAAECTATDNCSGEVEVTFEEVIVGDLPAEGSSADCLAMTPEAFEEGETCNGFDPWSLILFDFDNSEAVLYSAMEVNFVEYPDGTATLTGTVVRNDDPTRGWFINASFANAMDWNEWSTQAFPTGYKDDCNLASATYQDWIYYIMQSGATLTGWGANEGSTLNIAHAPSNYYYGYQVGVGANNVNNNYGSGGWFTFTGIYNGEEVSGAGDFAFDHDCCPRYSIERTWCASDCSGNETCFTQVISFEDLGLTPPVVGGDYAPVQVEKGQDFVLTKVQPNPAVDNAIIEFYSDKNNTVVLEVLDMNGRKVAGLFSGTVIKGQTYRFNVDASSLQSGIYMVRLASASQSDYTRLVVSR